VDAHEEGEARVEQHALEVSQLAAAQLELAELKAKVGGDG
jgi:hypothetical protein